VAELGLDRAGDLAAVGREYGLVERLLERALGLRRELAALRLGGLVDRELPRDGLPRVAALELACSARARDLVSTIRRSRRSGCANRSLFFS
jgi:hypothetical protein